VRDQEWDSALAQLHSLDLSELVLGLLGLDPVDGEAALGVVDQTEVLAGLLDGDNVHEAGWVGGIGADLAINLDQPLHNDRLGLARVERILETVPNEDDQWHAVPELVRTGRRPRGVGTGELVEKPMRWRAEALLVLLSGGQLTLALPDIQMRCIEMMT
jgi:hypothetical protein